MERLELGGLSVTPCFKYPTLTGNSMNEWIWSPFIYIPIDYQATIALVQSVDLNFVTNS